ncbi:MAG TPA: sigma-70 family RNA polymerase sigma factor [Polyangiaceae bacterium]|nr:sigma-70 family RNA polymerase sigma factor [Polyangiaceae bacterium]
MTRGTLSLEGRAPELAASSQSRLNGLVAENFDFIWRQLRRQGLSPTDADDAAQQVFMVATQKLDSIAPGRERSFLYGTALRIGANGRRATRRAAVRTDDSLESVASPALLPDARAELERAWTLLDELMGRLPAELARVLSLAEIEQLEIAEIAALEQIPKGTAASRLRRARETFHKLLKSSRKNPFTEGAR